MVRLSYPEQVCLELNKVPHRHRPTVYPLVMLVAMIAFFAATSSREKRELLRVVQLVCGELALMFYSPDP